MLTKTKKKQLRIVSLVLGTAIFLGCGFSLAQTVDTATLSDKQEKVKSNMAEKDEAQLSRDTLVPVTAVNFDGNKISAGVISFGCTSSSDFTVEHTIANGMCEVKIKRINRDMCKRAPFVATIELEWSQPDECRDLPISLSNPLLITSTSNTLTKQLK